QDGSGYLILHNFNGPAAVDGSVPFTSLVQGSDSALFGATDYGGSNSLGTIFKLNTNGTGFTVLHHFSGVAGHDGRPPMGELIEGTDGMVYGTTYYGGANDFGTLFRFKKDGTSYAVLHEFTDGVNG